MNRCLPLTSCLSHQHYAIYCGWRDKRTGNCTIEAPLNADRTSFLPHFLEEITDFSVLVTLTLLQTFLPGWHELMDITVLCAKIVLWQQRRESIKRGGGSLRIQLGAFIQLPVLLPTGQYHWNHCTTIINCFIYQTYQKNNLVQGQSLTMQK